MPDVTALKEFTSITTVYEQIHGQLVSNSLIGIATFIAILIIIKKFVEAFKQVSSDEKPADIKHFFNLFHIYIYTLAIVVSAPVAFSIVEKGLGKMQDEYISRFSGDVDMAVDEAVKKYEENYVKEELKGGDKGVVGVALASWWADKQSWFYTLLLYATKYTFYFFAAGRYLYLMLLQVVTPLAIVSFLDEKLRHYGENYLKHLLICYLMIPAFLMANTMGVKLGQVFIESLNSFSILALLCGFVFKVGLLKKANTYLDKLL